MLDAETVKNIAEVAGIAVVSTVTAIGGYLARGINRKPATEKNCDTCDQHQDMMVTVSKIPDIHDDVKALGDKFDDFLDQVWGVIRMHERKIGRLEGLTGAAIDDTRDIPHEKGASRG